MRKSISVVNMIQRSTAPKVSKRPLDLGYNVLDLLVKGDLHLFNVIVQESREGSTEASTASLLPLLKVSSNPMLNEVHEEEENSVSGKRCLRPYELTGAFKVNTESCDRGGVSAVCLVDDGEEQGCSAPINLSKIVFGEIDLCEDEEDFPLSPQSNLDACFFFS